ncbi:Crp/Fnr family transcriptional regulator [Tunicatimonas pelagia]|uniref:Crp/Fnr family transcriptional regulator n=1 Tax=Tunicatimonas pelagia TaxID=931531 RepID=UPI002664F327|nr:Crp/Fnr family transcriptional regulator [Tunicatimonas pelagia]WKN45458.1 Crp/Fnr family transcriptional regulator [Tunicatimonas pelagia]
MSTILRHHIEEITPVSDEEFDYILSHFKPKTLRKHQFLVQAGSLVDEDYFVTEGLLKSYYTNDQGKEHILQFAMKNWWITDYQAYFKRVAATTDIDCLEPCQVLCLSLHNRDKLCADLQKIEHFFRVKSNLGYVALQRRILSLLDQDAQGRYEQLIALYPSLLQRVPKTTLAAYLGVSRETLSRLH